MLVVLASILSCCHIRQENIAVIAAEVTGSGLAANLSQYSWRVAKRNDLYMIDSITF